MQHRLFGRSGLRVSELCLGTMTFGAGEWGADKAASRALFDSFANAGGTFIDTAHVYAEGESERMLGEFIASDRHHFTLATKYTATSLNGDLMKTGNSRKNMMRSIEESLRRLKTDFVDILLIHFWDFTTPIDEVMRGLNDLVASGKVNYVAASDLPAWEISRANMLADLRGWSRFIGIQIEYSLAERTPERDLLPMGKELDLGVMAWSPLKSGALTGNKDRSAGRSAMQPETDSMRRIGGVVGAIAQEIGSSPAQVALTWLRGDHRFGQIIPIIGARTVAQLEDNLGCLRITLSATQRERLDAVSRIELGFPHETLRSPVMRMLGTGSMENIARLDVPRMPS